VLKPENAAMKPLVFREGEVRVIGKVVGVIRRGI
jgi:SOS-response transcriptional repressor LexA